MHFLERKIKEHPAHHMNSTDQGTSMDERPS